jgi:endonuclease/exonuclease/phosphatase family metal-dependent hydrolase
VSVTLRVATANAAGGRDQRTGLPDLASWTKAVSTLDVDVLAVQEVDHLQPRSGGVDQTAEIAAACAGEGPAWTARFAAAVHGTPGSRHTMTPAPSTVDAEPSAGIALLSRFPVREWQELRMRPSRAHLPVRLPPTAPRRFLWIPDEQRVALAAVVEAPGGDITVICTHLSFAPPRALGQLRQIVRWARPFPRPMVLLGDLNLPGRVPALVTRWSPVARVPTYPAPGPRVQLDHVLVDTDGGPLHVRAAGVRVVGNSDHQALRAELSLDGPA